jgi:DNA-directed RNA polymerase subunit E'/Rpb7
MFIVTTVIDRIRVPAHLLLMPTLDALASQIDTKYPGRVILDVGLVICRYTPPPHNDRGRSNKIKDTTGIQQLSHGACVPGDGGSLHECQFQLVVFRPFVDEILCGTIQQCKPEGLQVRLGGFFQDILIPAYWMLNKSEYSEKTKEWTWTYVGDDDEDGHDKQDSDENENNPNSSQSGDATTPDAVGSGGADTCASNIDEEKDGGGNDETMKYPMRAGDQIQFRVKSIQFTEVTDTAKGRRATTTTTDHSIIASARTRSRSGSGSGSSHANEAGTAAAVGTSANTAISIDDRTGPSPNASGGRPFRSRSLSVDLSQVQPSPPSMFIIGSIMEDGLGNPDWWNGEEEEEGEEGDNDEDEDDKENDNEE